jgi:UV DNA damage repair endonuclease
VTASFDPVTLSVIPPEADVVNVHGGGAYGDKQRALAEFARNLDRLSSKARKRLTVENDDKIFTPADLLPICTVTSTVSRVIHSTPGCFGNSARRSMAS